MAINRRSHLPGFGFGQQINLFLEVIHDFRMLLLEDMGSLLRIQMHLVNQLAELGQLDVAVAVQDELETHVNKGRYSNRSHCLYSHGIYLVLGTTLSLLQTLGHGDDLDTQVGLLALDLETLHRQWLGGGGSMLVRIQMAQFL